MSAALRSPARELPAAELAALTGSTVGLVTVDDLVAVVGAAAPVPPPPPSWVKASGLYRAAGKAISWGQASNAAYLSQAGAWLSVGTSVDGFGYYLQASATTAGALFGYSETQSNVALDTGRGGRWRHGWKAAAGSNLPATYGCGLRSGAMGGPDVIRHHVQALYAPTRYGDELFRFTAFDGTLLQEVASTVAFSLVDYLEVQVDYSVAGAVTVSLVDRRGVVLDAHTFTAHLPTSRLNAYATGTATGASATIQTMVGVWGYEHKVT